MIKYTDIPVVPYKGLLNGDTQHKGGPAWPDWDNALEARQHRCNVTIDDEPNVAAYERKPIPEDTPLYWCGPVCTHFGHQVADFSSRIPHYDLSKTDILYCFAIREGLGMGSLEKTPAFFREILKWHRIPEDRVKLVVRPITAKELYVLPQHEQLEVEPSEAHLDALEKLATENGIDSSQKSGTYYISRSGQKKGKIAGDFYTEYILGLNGVQVIRPETLPLREQMRIYATAEHLIFPEGSALHALQLLGRQIGKVTVLSRRDNSFMARPGLTPRTTDLTYHTVGKALDGIGPKGDTQRAQGICIPDEAMLLEALRTAGVETTGWSTKAFKTAVQEDIILWLDLLRGRTKQSPKDLKATLKPLLTPIRQLNYKTSRSLFSRL